MSKARFVVLTEVHISIHLFPHLQCPEDNRKGLCNSWQEWDLEGSINHHLIARVIQYNLLLFIHDYTATCKLWHPWYGFLGKQGKTKEFLPFQINAFLLRMQKLKWWNCLFDCVESTVERPTRINLLQLN